MGFPSLLLLLLLFFLGQIHSLSLPTLVQESAHNSSSLSLLLTVIGASLDPAGLVLSSWSSPNATDPCTASYEGISCNEYGQVVNISLQGKGLTGQIPPEIAHLKNLSGLYLHFNQLHGVIPKEIAELDQLSELYLNVNNLSGEIPPQLGNMSSLQVLQLCYNKLTGSIPNQFGSLMKLNVLALQYNQLTGAIPASLGDLVNLTRLDLGFNHLFGSIPSKLANPPRLEILDIRNNTLTGNVPLAFKRLNKGFRYANNRGLCGIGYDSLDICSGSGINPNKPEPFGPGSSRLPSKSIPESANVKQNSSNQSKRPQTAVVAGVIGIFVIFVVTGLSAFSWYRRRKQKIGSAYDSSDSRLSTDQIKVACRRSASPLISLEYSHGWDPLARGQLVGGNAFSQEVFESFMFNLDEIESATQYFSDMNLLGKSSFSAIYKGTLRDGSVVAIKCISKTSCTSDEAEFLRGLKLLTSLKHENLVRIRGFCCSKGRGECFLIYDFVANGNLLQFLDKKDGKSKVIEWPARILIIKGIAKGIQYLHGNKGSKPALVHRNISAEKVLIDQHYNPLLSDCGLHKLLADDIVFSTLKGSAAMGYLAPEYTTTGRFTEKSDIYAFGMIIFQILSGKCKINQLIRQGAELCVYENFVDANLENKFGESEAAKLGKIALLCTHDAPSHRPTIETVMDQLNDIISSHH